MVEPVAGEGARVADERVVCDRLQSGGWCRKHVWRGGGVAAGAGDAVVRRGGLDWRWGGRGGWYGPATAREEVIEQGRLEG